MAPRDATKVDKVDRMQEQDSKDKRRGTLGTMYTKRRRVDEGSRKKKKGGQEPGRRRWENENTGRSKPRAGQDGTWRSK